jgi:hypothetical protein
MGGLLMPTAPAIVQAFVETWQAGFVVCFRAGLGFGLLAAEDLGKGARIPGCLVQGLELPQYQLQARDGFRGATLGPIGLVNAGCSSCRSIKLHGESENMPIEDRTFAIQHFTRRVLKEGEMVLTTYGFVGIGWTCPACRRNLRK